MGSGRVAVSEMGMDDLVREYGEMAAREALGVASARLVELKAELNKRAGGQTDG